MDERRTTMERIPKAVYTPEFRAEAVKLVEVEGLTVGQAAKRLSLPKASLGNWVRAARDGKLAEVGKGQRLPSELEMELARARKELAEVKMERDLLKKFAAYFAKESR
jgi:transposase